MVSFEIDEPPSFPPLFHGQAAGTGVDPFEKAVSMAVVGCDPGLVVHQLEQHRFRAAIVLAPELPLEDAMAMVFAASLGFADALGALAPPEVGVHFDWPAAMRVNGARCGRIRAAASTDQPDQEPDWLVISLDLPIFSVKDIGEPGSIPDATTLSEEGCSEISLNRLLESWTRHTLVWINTWTTEGMPPLHADWRARAYSLGDQISLTVRGETHSGNFVGLDERGGLLLRNGDQTDLYPLSTMLETT